MQAVEAGADVIAAARAWADADPDEATADRLRQLADDGDASLVAVMTPLQFGTAGLRGPVGPGPGQLNDAVVRRTAWAIAQWCLANSDADVAPMVVLGHDARPDSPRFAETMKKVLVSQGVRVAAFDTHMPTPIVAFAGKSLEAAATCIVTASHNPRGDNGIKVYGPRAIQIVPPADTEIAELISAAPAANEIPIAESTAEVRTLGQEIVDQYRVAVHGAMVDIDRKMSLVLVNTPLHGVGWPHVRSVLADAGYVNLHVVAEQAEPDGTFPTAEFPNPEEPGALDLAADWARRLDADLVLANDPDADRLAVMYPDASGEWIALTGNQVGCLLADHLLRNTPGGKKRLVANTIVSSPLLARIAEDNNATAELTHTGLKWIWTAADKWIRDGGKFVFGYEEAIGYCVGDVVRDKDGISAAVAFADFTAHLASRNRTIRDALDDLGKNYGVWVSDQVSVRFDGRPADTGVRIMDRLRSAPPLIIGGQQVQKLVDWEQPRDDEPAWRGPANLLEFQLSNGRLLVRPSGTEPKVKIYSDLHAPVDASPSAPTVAAVERELHKAASLVAQSLADRLHDIASTLN